MIVEFMYCVTFIQFGLVDIIMISDFVFKFEDFYLVILLSFYKVLKIFYRDRIRFGVFLYNVSGLFQLLQFLFGSFQVERDLDLWEVYYNDLQGNYINMKFGDWYFFFFK